MTQVDDFELVKVFHERVVAMLFLSIVCILTLVDLIEDADQGLTLGHTLTEFGVVLVSIAGVVYLWRRIVGGLEKRNSVLVNRLHAAHTDIAKWRAETESLSRGISEAIEAQLVQWGLSPAERDVAFLLLKGLSFKELAGIRATSERTVRQQAAAIYNKSGLEGRAQLSAFFLEDLLVSQPDTRAGVS